MCGGCAFPLTAHTHMEIHIQMQLRIYRHSLSGCAEFSTRKKRIRSISQRATQANRPRKKNRTEPNRTNWRTESKPRRQSKNDQTARRFLTDWRHRKTELNRTRKRKFRTQCAAQCAMRSETDKPTSRRAGWQAGRQRGGEDGQRDPARSPGHGAPASHFYAVHSACSAEGEQSPISKYECI